MKILKVLLQHLFAISELSAMLVGAVLTVSTHQACYGTNKGRQCFQHNLQCDEGKIFILKALRGFKPWYTSCPAQSNNCNHTETCCREDDQDCLEDYTLGRLSQFSKKCWNKSNCTYTVQKARRRQCSFWYEDLSRYSKVQYVCIQDSSIIDFRSETKVEESGVVLSYIQNSTEMEQAWHCQVESADCRSHPTDLLLTKSGNNNCSDDAFSRFCLNDTCFRCSEKITYALLQNFPTPFNLSVYKENRSTFDRAWAVVKAVNSVALTAACGIRGRIAPKACSTSSPAPTHPETSTSSISTAEVTTNPPMTPSSSSSAGLRQPPGGSVNIAGIVGGTVVATLVVVLVVLAIVVFVCVKRRAPQSQKASTVMAWFKGGNVRESAAMTSVSPGRESSDVTTSHPVRVNMAAAAAASGAGSYGDPDSDYHHLGQKSTSQSPRDVTYGHLAYGNDVNENAYDRVARGKPASSSGDVINNDYDTARPLTTASSDGGGYDVTSAAGNRRDVINNVYSIAKQ